jgi:predicted metal-dependent HD superfamily phosphohydrolase
MTPDQIVHQTWDDAVSRVAVAAGRSVTTDRATDRGAAADRAPLRQALLTAYREPLRAYHTLDHIAALLALFDEHGTCAREPDAVRLAILYHDIVYNPRRHDNEAASAAVAVRDLTALGAPPALIARVAALVLATQHGAAPPDRTDTDLCLLLDLDLSVLAAAPAIYDAYAAAIRREYAHVPGLLYRPGRRKVLQRFVDTVPLYLTPHLADRWDAAARQNLRREIAGV